MSTVVWWTEESDGYTFSSGNTVATSDASTRAVLLARRGLVSGMWYWETEYTNVGATNTSMSLSYGFAQSSVSKTNIPGAVDALGWSNDINGTGRVHNSETQASSAAGLSARPKVIIRHWFNADTGQYQVSYSDDGLAVNPVGWRDLGYHTATHDGSSWDTAKVWYPAYSVDTINEVIEILSTASTCYFSPPAGAKYLSTAPLVVSPKGVSDEVFNAWLKTDADRVMLIEAQYSTGEPDLLGLTGDGSTEQDDGITLLNDVTNQPGNSAYAAGYTNATIIFGERKYWEVRPTRIPDLENVWIGFKIKDAIDATEISGTQVNELGLSPLGQKWISGTEVNCFCPCATTILDLEPVSLMLFDEIDSSWTPALITTAFWIDAADSATITLDGSSNVEQWDDKSGNDNHVTQASSGIRPSLTTLNGKTAVSFSGSETMTHTYQNTTSNSYVWFGVVEAAAQTGYRGIYSGVLAGGTLNMMILASGATDKWGTFSGVFKPSTTSIVEDGATILTVVKYSVDNTTTFFRDGAEETFFSGAGAAQAAHVGGITGQEFQGKIAEIIVVETGDDEISVADQQKIEGYLAHKWGLEALLPVDHLYKDAPPTII